MTEGAVSLTLSSFRIRRRPVCHTNYGGMFPPDIVLNVGGKDGKSRLQDLIH